MALPVQLSRCGRCLDDFPTGNVITMGAFRCKNCTELEEIAVNTSNDVIKNKIKGVPGMKPAVKTKKDLFKHILFDLENDRKYLEQAKKRKDESMIRSLERQVKDLEEAVDIAEKFA